MRSGGLSAGGRNGEVSKADLVNPDTGEISRFAPPVRSRRTTAVPIRELPQRKPHVCLETGFCISPKPHVHSLARCDRSKRVCTADGRYREGEQMRVVRVPADEERFVDTVSATVFGISPTDDGAPAERSSLRAACAETSTLPAHNGKIQWWRSDGGPWDLVNTAAYRALPPPEKHEVPARWETLVASMVPIPAEEGGVTLGGKTYEFAPRDIGRCVGASPFRGASGPKKGDAALAADACVGPIESAPPFICAVQIALLGADGEVGAIEKRPQFKEGQTVCAVPTYFGGTPGKHIYRWMKISSKGIRTDAIVPTACTQPDSAPGSYEGDPRVLHLSKELAGCKLKVKVVALRSDGEFGNDMSSKPSRAVEWVSTPPPSPDLPPAAASPASPMSPISPLSPLSLSSEGASPPEAPSPDDASSARARSRSSSSARGSAGGRRSSAMLLRSFGGTLKKEFAKADAKGRKASIAFKEKQSTLWQRLAAQPARVVAGQRLSGAAERDAASGAEAAAATAAVPPAAAAAAAPADGDPKPMKRKSSVSRGAKNMWSKAKATVLRKNNATPDDASGDVTVYDLTLAMEHERPDCLG